MNTFTEIIDTYIANYYTYKNGKVEFDCKYGELIFNKDNSNTLIVFGIYIFPEYRRTGICQDILQYLVDAGAKKFKWLSIQAVLSKILYDYLLRFEYKNKQFSLEKEGFFYKLF